jgi:micrococcal nuclease
MTKNRTFSYRAKIIKIVDGDTVDVDLDLGFSVWLRKQRVRLYGIDTPECRTRDLEEKKLGLLAKQKVQEMCPVGSTIELKTIIGDERGKFGRILGIIEVDDVDARGWSIVSVNQFLVENNYAVAYHGQSKDDIKDEHIKNAEILKERGEV